jgi:hypothetical protein
MHNYKTTMCRQWAEFGECSYYHRCLFVHDEKPGQVSKKKKTIENPLNPNAKVYEPKTDYDQYWNIIHNLIIRESEALNKINPK